MERIYLDANGSSLPIKEAKMAVCEKLDYFGNPSSSYEEGRSLKKDIDETRQAMSKALGASKKDIFFTSGASEANRWFVDSLSLLKKTFKRPIKVLMSPFEHPSLRKPVFNAADKGLISLNIIDVQKDGALIVNEGAIKEADVVICCQAHNETGILPNLYEIIEKLNDETIFMSDVAQSLSRLENIPRRIDFMTFSAQKMGAYAGIGGFLHRGNAKMLTPPWQGGGQEQGMRPGTESYLLLMAFKAALRKIGEIRKKHQELITYRDYFERELKSKANVKVIGEDVARLTNTSAITFYNVDPEALRISCDMAGLSVGFGAACSGLAPEGSYALGKLSLTLSEQKSTIRFSMPHDISKDIIEEAINRLLNQVLI